MQFRAHQKLVYIFPPTLQPSEKRTAGVLGQANVGGPKNSGGSLPPPVHPTFAPRFWHICKMVRSCAKIATATTRGMSKSKKCSQLRDLAKTSTKKLAKYPVSGELRDQPDDDVSKPLVAPRPYALNACPLSLHANLDRLPVRDPMQHDPLCAG